MDLKLHPGPAKAGQIVYDQQETGKRVPYHPGQNVFIQVKVVQQGKEKEGTKRVPVPVKKRFNGHFKLRQVK